jgi:hypothetical protein
MGGTPYFLWSGDDRVSEEEFRAKLRSPDTRERARWMGRLLREARSDDVWKYVTVSDVLRDWSEVERHLGRSKPFWRFLLDGWRQLGLIP